MPTLTQRAQALREAEQFIGYRVTNMGDGVYYAIFADEEDMREHARNDPLFAGFKTLLLHGMPAYELGHMQ